MYSKPPFDMNGEVEKHTLDILNYQFSSNRLNFIILDIFNH